MPKRRKILVYGQFPVELTIHTTGLGVDYLEGICAVYEDMEILYVDGFHELREKLEQFFQPWL